MNLDPQVRNQFVARLMATLRTCDPLEVNLRGSLANGTADIYSDIDIEILVRPSALINSLEKISATLVTFGPVLSIRVDPEWAGHAEKAVLFLSYSDLPLFWRIDLLVMTPEGHCAKPLSQSTEVVWSPFESALWNCVGAMKAWARGRQSLAEELFQRGLERASENSPPGPLPRKVSRSAMRIREKHVQLSELANKVSDLAGHFEEQR